MNRFPRKQNGFTLIELIVGLIIIAGVVVGALSLYNSANTSSASTQMLKDLTAIRASTQGLYQGQGGYGAGTALNAPLITGNKIPTTMNISGSTITASNNGTVTVTGNTATFTMTLTNVDAAMCTSLLSTSSMGWSAVKVGSGTAIITFPVTPVVATSASNCGGTAPFSIMWTTVN